MDKNSKIYVAGHKGMVGSSVIRSLRENGFRNLVFRTSKELDLTRQMDNEPVNIGVGEDLTIRELAERVKQVVRFEGEIAFDISRPDGVPQKLLDVSRLQDLGWKAQTDIEEGISQAYEWYLPSLLVDRH
jgi:nucleoside-diphosphate-sugar epimerase